jgi:S-adenosylmethionine:tRNA ribosyltransferase-isomerase
LPPYLNRDADATDEGRYQTLYAKDEGSVAAPTAGLHFTQNVMAALAGKHIDTDFVTLHVGAGTFRPVKSDTMVEHDMHAEWIEVSLQLIQKLRGTLGSKIVAVGTTSMRTLESLYWIGNSIYNGSAPDLEGIAVTQWQPYETNYTCTTTESLKALADYMEANNLTKLITRTQILIAPGYEFKIATGLVTNFHQPQSTLLLLVAALTGDDWRKIYDYALGHEFRFLSYGDGSLLWGGKA